MASTGGRVEGALGTTVAALLGASIGEVDTKGRSVAWRVATAGKATRIFRLKFTWRSDVEYELKFSNR